MLRGLVGKVRSGIGRRLRHSGLLGAPARPDNESYWTDHNVNNHQRVTTISESLAYFDGRNDQYPGYIDLMPVRGQDGRVVLDYGCGPGHDLVGFGHYSRPARLIGIDIAQSSLAEAKLRLDLHCIKADLIHITEADERLPLDDVSVDYLHSSGVVHHARDPHHVLREFRRVLKPGGVCRIMVYNYN